MHPWVKAGESPQRLSIHHHAAKQINELSFNICCLWDHKASLHFFHSLHHLRIRKSIQNLELRYEQEFPPHFLLSHPPHQNLQTPIQKHLIFPLTIIVVSRNVLLHKNVSFSVYNSSFKIIPANSLSLTSCFPGITKTSSIQAVFFQEIPHLSALNAFSLFCHRVLKGLE